MDILGSLKETAIEWAFPEIGQAFDAATKLQETSDGLTAKLGSSVLGFLDLDDTGAIGMSALGLGGTWAASNFMQGDIQGAITIGSYALAVKELSEGDWGNAAGAVLGGMAINEALEGDYFSAALIGGIAYVATQFLNTPDAAPAIAPTHDAPALAQ